ncbi:MAG: type III pantothenate kinase [Bacteroidales bacterium]|nr:type III pantothenate kinase [Bacteroidales bacterium]
MNLVFDIGNSGTKLAVFDGPKKITFLRTKEFSFEKLHKKMAQYQIDRAIVCAVKNVPEFIIDIIKANYPVVHILSHKSKLPFSIEYEKPETLGPDRIAAVAGAYVEFPGKNVLVIDAGTAITFEFLSGDIYKGGNISPGLTMRFKALNKFTDKLPLISPTDNYTFPGHNTNDAIRAGVITGVTYEINEYIRAFEKQHAGSVIILTGGDSEYLKNKILPSCTYMPDIVINGLNFILEYNAK